jgi:exopolysaccharide biosynthesis glucuronosyltransferase PssE
VIFVTVGTNEAAFDRLVVALDRIPLGEEIFAQCGSSSNRPGRATCVDFLPFEELTELVRRARVVVTHAGAGSTMVALANGKRPIVVPRLRRYGEAVDDHQVHFARRLAESGLVTIAEDPENLVEVLRAVEAGASDTSIVADKRLVEDLRRMIADALGPTPHGRSESEQAT